MAKSKNAMLASLGITGISTWNDKLTVMKSVIPDPQPETGRLWLYDRVAA